MGPSRRKMQGSRKPWGRRNLGFREMAETAVPVIAIFIFAFSVGRSNAGAQPAPAKPGSLRVTSPAFQSGGRIPPKYTCDGKNISPGIEWSAPPQGTESLALIVEDPDAPGKTWIHWVAYDLPSDSRGLPEGVPNGATIKAGGRQGRNDFGDLGYGGPCPPPGKPHHYHFSVYALSSKLPLQPGASKEDVVKAMGGRVLSEGELVGMFHR